MPLYPRFKANDVCLVLATTNLPDPPMPLDEKRQEQTTALRLIQAKYDAGIPLFTKDLFRDLVRQLDSDHSTDQGVSVTGLDGLAVHFPVETGRDYPSHPYGDDHICIITKPQLGYHSIQSLLAIQDPVYYFIGHSCMYLPVKVVHSTEVRNAETNELVDLWPTSDYATVKQKFEEARRYFGASEHFAQVKATLTSAAVPPGIDKVIALACSTMTWADDGFLRSMAQHALALTIRDLLASSQAPGADEEGAREIQCYAQDPIYTPVDEQVLSEAGFTVLDDPRAFLEIDEASVVICISPDIPARQIVADIARPAVIIWDKIAVSDQKVFCTDPVSPRVIQMMEEYVELPFPAEDEYFGDLAIYIRKGG